MRSTFYGLEIARSGLYTSQNELNITGHNISNVDTLGYTRQRLITAAVPALAVNTQFAVDSRALSGTGVEALTVDQIRSDFTDAKYRAESSVAGYWTTYMEEFSMVEQIYNSALDQTGSSGSVLTALTNFKSALNELAKDKTNSTDIRTVVQDAGKQLAESINYVYGKLEEQHNNLNTAISLTVDQINSYAQNIANLNKQIYGYELTGSKANDLRDSRNLLLDELSGMVDIEYYQNSKGQLVVTIGGRELVDGVDYNLLAVDENGATNKLDEMSGIEPPGTQYTVKWADGLGNPGQKQEDVLRFTGGALKAYFDLRDGDTSTVMGIPYVAEQINELCRKIAEEVNEIHRQGYTMPYKEVDALTSVSPSLHHMEDDGSGNLVAGVNADGTYVWEINFSTEVDPITGTEYYPSTNGIDFFYTGNTADYRYITGKTFRLSDEVASNVNLIASSSTQMTIPDEGYPNSNQFYGDTDNMLKITALFAKENELGQPDNFESKANAMLVSVFSQQSYIKQMQKAQETRLTAVEQERASVSSVSLDEEMTNVVRFTHAYNAAARVLTAMDEELDTLINKMGLVGR